MIRQTLDIPEKNPGSPPMNGDIIKVSVIMQISSLINSVTTFHYKDNASGVDLDAYQMASDYSPFITPTFKAAVGANTAFRTINVEFLAGPGAGKVGIFTYPAGVNGTKAGPFLTPNMAVVLGRNTGRAGRTERGRIFVGTIAQGDMDSIPLGEFNTSTATMIAFGNQLSATFTTQAAVLDPVLVGPQSAGYPATTPIKHTVLNQVVRSLRSRLLRVD